MVLLVSVPLFAAQGATPSAVPKPAASPAVHDPAPAAQNPGAESDLKAVLAKMNANAGTFKTAEADFEFETYQKVVDEKDVQKGRIYFRRAGRNVDAAFNITAPAAKQVVYKDGKIRIYEPRIDQVTERDVSKNKSEVESYLSLGFGARGDDLLRDYEVKMGGWETVDGVKTAKLELTPKAEKMRQTYNSIVLWIDPEKDVLLKQQFLEPSGDYRLKKKKKMKLNARLGDDEFKLKTTGSTKMVKAQ